MDTDSSALAGVTSKTRLVAVVAIMVASLALAAGDLASTAEAAKKNTVVLGSKMYVPNGLGFGRRAPARIFNGGVPNGLVVKIHWRRWGSPVAIGRGRGHQYKPGGGYFAKRIKVRLRARKIGRCSRGGGRAYTQLRAQFQRRPGGKFGRWFYWSGDRSICSMDYSSLLHEHGAESEAFAGSAVVYRGKRWKYCGTIGTSSGSKAKVSGKHVRCRRARRIAEGYYNRRGLVGNGPDGRVPDGRVYYKVRGFRCFTGLGGSEAYCQRHGRRVVTSTQKSSRLPGEE